MMDGHHSSRMGKGAAHIHPGSVAGELSEDLWVPGRTWVPAQQGQFTVSRQASFRVDTITTVGSRGPSWVTQGREDQKLLEEEKGKAVRAEKNASDLGERNREGGRLSEFSAAMEEQDDHTVLSCTAEDVICFMKFSGLPVGHTGVKFKCLAGPSEVLHAQVHQNHTWEARYFCPRAPLPRTPSSSSRSLSLHSTGQFASRKTSGTPQG